MKPRQNKLDRYAEQLDGWLGVENITLDQAVEKLRDLGCSSSRSAVGAWWDRRRSAQMQERLLGQIASGSQQCREVEAALNRSGAPELETLIKLHRVLILKLSTEANVNPEMIELVGGMMKPVMEFAKLEAKKVDQALDERRVKIMEQKAAQADEAKQVTGSDLTAEEKAMRMKQIFGMS